MLVSQATQALVEDEEEELGFTLVDVGERRLKDNPTTLEDLSQQYGISRERVRQIEVRAFEKLQKAIKAAAIERRLVA